MPRFIVHFRNGHTESVTAADGTEAKKIARRQAGLAKDSRKIEGEDICPISRVEPVGE